MLWTFLFASLLVVVTAVTSGRETIQLVHTQGVSGEKCMSSRRYCLTGKRCMNEQCRCPSNETGRGDFDCFKSREKACYMIGDTRVQGFGGAAAPINLPCSYRASRFLTRMNDGMSFCMIEVHVTNEAWRDAYRTRGVHVAVGVTEPALQLNSNTETMVTGTFGANNSRIYSYKIRKSPIDVMHWGSGRDLRKSRQDTELIQTIVDEDNNFIVLDVPACNTHIKFRAYDPIKGAMAMLPGVSIDVPDTAEFIEQYGNYPFSMCGRPTDRGTLYRGRAGSKGLTVANAILSDILEKRPPQFDNPMDVKCQVAMDLYESSLDKKSDMTACGFLLAKKSMRRCLQNKHMLPIDVFNACFKFRQSSDDADACSTLQTAASKCRPQWVGSTPFCAK